MDSALRAEALQRPVIVLGGNGFVGTHIIEQLASRGQVCIAVSRTGAAPAQLLHQSPEWIHRVEWVKGDAANLDPTLLEGARALVSTIGSPPLPTFSEAAKDRQSYANGTVNQLAIEAAGRAGLRRLILINAHIPKCLQSNSFGYYLGKTVALNAAREFAQQSPGHRAVVFKPSGIYGVRYTRSGRAIPLHWFMAPIAWLQARVPVSIRKWLPETLVSVDELATYAAKVILDDDDQVDSDQFGAQSNFQIVDNEQLVNFE